MAQQTFTIATSADDDEIERTNSLVNYPPTTSETMAPTRVIVAPSRSNWGAPNYEVIVGLLRWDTSSLPDGATITGATLRMRINQNTDTNGLSLCAGWGAWTGVAADYSNVPDTGAHAGTAISAITLNTYTDFALTGYAANVSTTGTTGLKLWITQRASDAAPTGGNYVGIDSTDNVGGFTPPQLIVDYSTGPPPTPIAPDAIIGTPLNLTGTVADIDEDPDSADANWLTMADPSGSTGLTNGPELPDASAAVSGFTAAFTTPANVYDGSDTTAATLNPAATGTNNGSYFSFAAGDWTDLPSNATITDASLEVIHQVGTNNRSDQFFQLGTANGTLIGNELQSDATTTKSTVNLNGWTTLPTRAQLVTGTFGIRVRTLRTNTLAAPGYSLFSLRLTVTYDIPAATTNTDVRVSFPTPSGSPQTGAGLQEYRVLVRKKGSAGSNPTATIAVRETGGGSNLATALAATAVSSTTGTVLSGTWDASVLGTSSGSAVECYVTGTAVAGAGVEVGAIMWNAAIVTGPTDITRTLNDTLALGGQTLRTQARTINGTLSASDALLRTQARTPNDTQALTDSLSARSLIRTLSDTESLIDSLLRSRTRTATEAEALIDSHTRVQAFSRTLNDAQALLDSLARSRMRTLNEGEALGDAVTKLSGTGRTLNDAQALADSLTRSRTRTSTDTEALADSYAKTQGYARTSLDSLSLVDTTLRSRLRLLTDALAASDAILRGGVVNRTLNDTGALSDSVLRSAVRVVLDALAGFTPGDITPTPGDTGVYPQDAIKDTVIVTSVTNRSAADTLSLADGYAKASGYLRTASDTEALSDALALRSRSRALLDTLSAADAYAKVQAFSRTLNNTVSLADAYAKTQAFIRSLNNTVSLADFHNTGGGTAIVRTITDTMAALTPGEGVMPSEGTYPGGGLSDNVIVNFVQAQARTLSDQLALVDTYAKTQGYARTSSDVLTLSDALQRLRLRTLTDTLAGADTVLRARIRALSDTLAGADATQRARIRTLSDTLAGTDAVQRARVRTLSDTLASADATLRARVRALVDTLAGADQASPSIVGSGLSRTLTDSLAAADAYQKVMGYAKVLLDTEALLDAYAKTQVFNRTSLDTEALADTYIKAQAYSRTVLADTLAATDSISPVLLHLISRSVADLLGTSDAYATQIIVGQIYSRTFQDALALVDYLQPTHITAAQRQVPQYRIYEVPGRFERRFLTAPSRHPSSASYSGTSGGPSGRTLRIPRRLMP